MLFDSSSSKSSHLFRRSLLKFKGIFKFCAFNLASSQSKIVCAVKLYHIYLHMMNILNVLYYKRITLTGYFYGYFPNILNHTNGTNMEWNYK